MKIREMIEKHKIGINHYNPMTKEKGEFLQVPNGKEKLTAEEIDYIRNNKPEIISEIKKMEEEKIIAERQAIENEKNDYIKTNKKLNLSLFFTNWGRGVSGLPAFLEDKTDLIAAKIEFDNNPFDGDYGSWTLEISTNDLLAKIKEIENEINVKKEEKRKTDKKYFEQKLAEAKEKNESVVLTSWSDECTDPHEECNIDNITKYVNPDGTTKIVRFHTY